MSNIQSTGKFVHHVIFYLKDPSSQSDRQKLLEGLQSLEAIPCVLFDIGTPAATNRPVIVRDYDFSLLCIFNSPEEEAEYQKHPIHDNFRDNYAHLWGKVIIYDSITHL